jgi:hypothetical protein
MMRFQVSSFMFHVGATAGKYPSDSISLFHQAETWKRFQVSNFMFQVGKTTGKSQFDGILPLPQPETWNLKPETRERKIHCSIDPGKAIEAGTISRTQMGGD